MQEAFLELEVAKSQHLRQNSIYCQQEVAAILICCCHVMIFLHSMLKMTKLLNCYAGKGTT